MTFYKVTDSKYIGPGDYTLRKDRDGSFSVFKGNVITSWGTSFKTVRSAESFFDRHDCIHASINKLPISNDDLCYAEEAYCLTKSKSGYSLSPETSFRVIKRSDKNYQLIFSSTSTCRRECISDVESLFSKLDDLIDKLAVEAQQFSDCQLASIFAKKSGRGAGSFNRLKRSSSNFEKRDKRRTPQEISRSLVRVKSSNVWAYGVEMQQDSTNEGNVYVQFKGKNGGPGDIYVYYSVDLPTWRKVLSYPSKGSAVWRFLRNNFMYSKLTGDKKGKLPNAINH